MIAHFKRQSPNNLLPSIEELKTNLLIPYVHQSLVIRGKLGDWGVIIYRSLLSICSTPDKPCDFMGDLPPGLSSVCQQKFVERHLMALDPAFKEPVMNTFRIPSAHVCYIREKAGLPEVLPITTAVPVHHKRQK